MLLSVCAVPVAYIDNIIDNIMRPFKGFVNTRNLMEHNYKSIEGKYPIQNII